MSKPERLELTFGKKDMDLWQFLEATGLPKASFVKKILRDYMQEQPAPTRIAAPVTVYEPVAETNSAPVIQEQDEVKKPKSTSLFSGAAVKK